MLLDAIIRRAGVVASSAVTWIALAVAGLHFLLTQDVIAETPDLADWITQAASLLGGVLLVIRRVTPVEPEERGLLPVEGGAYDEPDVIYRTSYYEPSPTYAGPPVDDLDPQDIHEALIAEVGQ